MPDLLTIRHQSHFLGDSSHYPPTLKTEWRNDAIARNWKSHTAMLSAKKLLKAPAIYSSTFLYMYMYMYTDVHVISRISCIIHMYASMCTFLCVRMHACAYSIEHI